MKGKWLMAAAAFLIVPFVLQGCGFGNNEVSTDMDEPPEELSEDVQWEEFGDMAEEQDESAEEPAESEKEQAENTEDGSQTVAERELYLISEDGMVVPHTFELPAEEGALRQSLEYLVQDGPISTMIPNGFQAVLPPGTEVDVHLTEDGTAVADFSPEFRDYDPNNEQAVLQAVTWTLTQFDNVDQVKFQINGYDQDTMPVENTPIGEAFSRENGINLDNGDVADMTNSGSVTVYFLSQTGDSTYYVPVTRRVENFDKSEELQVVMEELMKGPSSSYSSLHGVIRDGAELQEETALGGETASVFFNEAILTEQEGTAISEEALHAITLSATEIEGVETVELNVEGVDEVIQVSGEPVNEPLSRPASINAVES
ncbi:germination protein M [Alteribacillus persepolensis]|uniref:Germination protein M n=1 Tax=Alteribacillus persepolensis TaxID=568899 RepID=A0A1G8BPN9_9BACI|nr:GerMN domain-containing protein [Alteribacillus persepolensis]SDH35121.1 germination protein M [Alteribacillus persepolensis]